MTTDYHLILASDVSTRNGIGLELTRDDNEERVAEVFSDDTTGLRTFTAFEEGIPVEAIEWLLERARDQL
ncbi:hypothetical protein BH11ACT2_BH11ACT2_03840 [soil metagenome]